MVLSKHVDPIVRKTLFWGVEGDMTNCNSRIPHQLSGCSANQMQCPAITHCEQSYLKHFLTTENSREGLDLQGLYEQKGSPGRQFQSYEAQNKIDETFPFEKQKFQKTHQEIPVDAHFQLRPLLSNRKMAVVYSASDMNEEGRGKSILKCSLQMENQPFPCTDHWRIPPSKGSE